MLHCHLSADDPKERHNCTPVQRLDPKLRHGSFYCQCVWSSESHVRNERHVTLFKHQRVLPWSFGSYCIAARWYVLNWFTSEEPLQTSDICLHKPELIILLSRCLVKARADWLCFSYVGSRKSSNFDSQTENQNIQKKWMKGMPCISTQNSLLAMHILMGDFEWLNFPAVAHVILFCFWVYIKTNIIIMCLIHSLLVKFWPPLREY